MGLTVHLVDGTYELFRYHFGQPEEARSRPGTSGAVRGVLGSVLSLIEDGATHIGVATDHVIESFRNDLWPGYKSSAGVDPVLLAQFPVLEDGLMAMGVRVFPMVDLEADDALATAAAVAAADDRVERVAILTPDKDLGQAVVGRRVVQVDRRKRAVIDEDAILARYGIRPESIPDWLALVGDSADGFPGLPGWGAKTASAVLARYPHLEDIPAQGSAWGVNVRGAGTLAATLVDHLELAVLFRRLATLVIEPTLLASVDDLEWGGPSTGFASFCEGIGAPPLAPRAAALAAAR